MIVATTDVCAQRPLIYKSPQYEFNTAVELFQKEKYGAAQQYFKYVYENTTDQQQDLHSHSYFYMGVCAACLLNEDAAFLLKDFIRRYPAHSLVPEAYFYAGRYYFNKQQYRKVIECFELLDARHVKKEDVAEYKFKKGYAYLELGNRDEAHILLHESKYGDSPYSKRATYYLAHIEYEEGHYEAALQNFLTLKDDPDYVESVPYYLVQIYFTQGRYQELIDIAPSLLKVASDKNRAEINRATGIAYYSLGKYAQAAACFDNFLQEGTPKLERNDNFAIGYTYYQVKRYQDAIEYLYKTTSEKDATTQNSYYIIGDCYLQNNQYAMASQSFSEAGKYDYMPAIKEDALYNYAKLQYQTSTGSFNSAIKALEDYINQYPNSSRNEEANAYLSSIYMSTKNYQGAINSIEKIQSKSPSILKAYQRCTHFRALELINNRNHDLALAMLEKSLSYPMDKYLNISNLYWKGECEYRKGNVQQAYFSLQNYRKNNLAAQDENYAQSAYSYGYAALKTGKYEDAKQAFTEFLKSNAAKNDMVLKADACARLGDCYLMQRDLKQAIAQYEKCETLKQQNADYALYQQAQCYGFQQNYAKKANLLEKLMVNYPKSPYIDDAEYELAGSYHTQKNYTLAINAYKSFIRKYPKSPYIRQAYTHLAQSYLNNQNQEEAIATYKHVFETYPGSQEAKDAMGNLESIYTDQGNTIEFFDYIRRKSNIDISKGKQDSSAFKAAELRYMRGDCEAAVTGLTRYLDQFSTGLFAAKAHFYRAECAYGMNRFDAALSDYESLINNYRTEDYETAIKKAATITYNKKDYATALKYFNLLGEVSSSNENQLLGMNGRMRCAYELKNYEEVLVAVNALLELPSLDPDLKADAQYIGGKSAYELNNYPTAKKLFGDLTVNNSNDAAAESAYLIAYIELKQNNIETCEKQIASILGSNYSSEYWLASTFILYGDLYVKKGNYFQARHTYQSIVDNYECIDLKETARRKIAELDDMEKKNKTNE
jgi:tetratricopeptide (TPR) repeat protein